MHTLADEICAVMREAIEGAIPNARVEVTATGPGHFAVHVVSLAFQGKSRVQQQQMVYSAIADLMHGDNAPVHAIDRLQTAVA
jgi:stress-induced morphogen